VVTDAAGTEIALYGQPGDILIYPTNAVAKRWVTHEIGFLPDFADETSQAIASLHDSAPCDARRRRMAAPWVMAPSDRERRKRDTFVGLPAGPGVDHFGTRGPPLRGRRMTDDELIAVARAAAAARGRDALRDAQVTRCGAEAEVLLSDPAYARGGGLLVVIYPATGAVLRVVPQL
jgi:hypothetical protein